MASAALRLVEGSSMDKSKALDAALSQIERNFGKGSIMRLGKNSKSLDVETVSTGSLGLDIALGVGGLPRGRVVEIYGPESSGKTTLCLQVVAQVQRAGGPAAYIDAENALDPKAEIEGEMGDQVPGLQARPMSQALRKLTANIKRANTLVIFINQIRMKIGVMFGNPETTTGGNALKFYASVRMDIRRVGALKDGERVVGNRPRVKVVKNKMAPPFRQAEFDIMYNQGISVEGSVLDVATDLGIVRKSGAWFGFGGDRIGQGRENAKQFLREHPDVARKIEAKIRANAGVTEAAPAL